MIEKNFVKEKIKSGKAVIGTWNTMGSTVVTEVLAHSGLDFVIVDNEHGPFSLTNINDFVNAAEKHQCSPIFRVPLYKEWMVLQALDQGAHGVMIPHIETHAEVVSFINNAKFYPIGTRGYTPFTKAGGYSNLTNPDYTNNANNLTLTSIIIESLKGIENLDEILENRHLDLVYLGAYDISQALGVPGQVKDPKVIRVMKDAIDKISKSGKCPGGFVAKSQDDIKWLLDIGIRFIPYQVDCAILLEHMNKITTWFRGEIK